VAIGKLGNSVLVRVTDTVRMHLSEAMVPNDTKGLTDLYGSSRMETGVARSMVGDGGGSIAGEAHGL
jgi:hypothetical protein